MAQEMTYNGVKITLVTDDAELSSLAADIILERIDSKRGPFWSQGEQPLWVSTAFSGNKIPMSLSR